MPPPLQPHTQQAQQASLPPSAADVPPAGLTPSTVAYRTRQLNGALADWLWRPFIQGLAFGLGTHLSLYTYQRFFLRQSPQLPFIAHINPDKNSSSSTASTASTASTSAGRGVPTLHTTKTSARVRESAAA